MGGVGQSARSVKVARSTDQWVQRAYGVKLIALWICARTPADMYPGDPFSPAWDPDLEANPCLHEGGVKVLTDCPEPEPSPTDPISPSPCLVPPAQPHIVPAPPPPPMPHQLVAQPKGWGRLADARGPPLYLFAEGSATSGVFGVGPARNTPMQ